MLVLVMGVSGSGKTSVGVELAGALALPYFDADDFHPAANVAKMAAGYPLDDGDRAPWLTALGEVLAKAARDRGCVLGCSALKEAYRAQLRAAVDEPLHVVYLEGSRELLLERVSLRAGHFFPPELLDSQLAVLEHPVNAITVSIAEPVERIVREVVASLGG